MHAHGVEPHIGYMSSPEKSSWIITASVPLLLGHILFLIIQLCSSRSELKITLFQTCACFWFFLPEETEDVVSSDSSHRVSFADQTNRPQAMPSGLKSSIPDASPMLGVLENHIHQ